MPEREIAGRRRLFGRLRDRIAASDPAFSRQAPTATLSRLLSLLLMGAVTGVWSLPISAG